jgi:hypothetical protein
MHDRRRIHGQRNGNAMGHQITALVGRLPVDEAAAADFGLTVIANNGFAIVPLDAAHEEAWEKTLDMPSGEPGPILLDCPVAHAFARRIFGDQPYAIVDTDYWAGVGEQAAVVYRGGAIVLPLSQGEYGPINAALAFLGVTTTAGCDEFDAIGLGNVRSTYTYFEAVQRKRDDV